jgi:hypothetical protein
MRVVVYVEGPSDKAAMEKLLKPLLEEKLEQGVTIHFFYASQGDRKAWLLLEAPRRAVNILLNQLDSFVVAMPDLYPRNKAFPHETFDELSAGVWKNFRDALRAKRPDAPPTVTDRFRVFCFKHDLEALLLAAVDPLKRRLGASSLPVTWRVPVEDQNHHRPPKRVVEDLFVQHGSRYKDTVDAPLILAESSYEDLAEKCPQCFKPFVEFLSGLQP